MRIFKCSLAKFFQGSMPPDPLEGVVPLALPLMQFVTSQHLYPPFHFPHRTLLEPPLAEGRGLL